MAYVSLYRKYRPQTFADVMGQEHVTRTLQNAIKAGRIAHGYLFTGTRGTAKTTVARLLAKALNCDRGPAAEPCNECEACTSITGGSCIDVIEMDAASHRGVADIEEVRKAVGYGPMQFRYKVFIIDEAHQLSSDAKDAFLKTLEEPPDNVVFILATTEPQAIPITIRSRCQQYDFRRGSLADIAARLRYVLEREGVSYTTEAVNLVARGAEGSYRDSLSLLEQVLAYTPERLSAADVETVLGALDAERLGQIVDVVARHDAPEAFALAGSLIDAGKEARTLLRTLSAHFRDLLLVSVGGPAVASQLTPEEVRILQEQARRFTPPQMMRAIDILNEAQGETRWNNQHRLLVELTFLKLMNLGDGPAAAPFATAPIVFGTTSPAAPITSAPSAPAPSTPAPPVAAPAPSAIPVTTPAVPVAVPAPATPAPVPPPSAENKPVVAPPATVPANIDLEPEDELPVGFFASDEDESDDEDDYAPEDLVAPPADEPEDDGPSLFDELDAPAPVVVAPSAPAVADEPMPPPLVPPQAPSSADDANPTRELAAVVAPGRVPEPKAIEEELGPPEAAIPLNDVLRAWPRFLQEAEGISKQAAVMMATAHPTNTVGKMVTVTFSQRANYEMMGAPKKLEFVRKLLGRCLGIDGVQIRLELDTNAPPPPKRAPKEKKKLTRDIVAAAEQATLTSSGYDVFGAGVTPAYTAPAPIAPAPAVPAVGGPRPKAEETAFFTPPPEEPSAEANGAAATDGQTAALDEPLVQEALSIFGGEVVKD